MPIETINCGAKRTKFQSQLPILNYRPNCKRHDTRRTLK